VPALTLRPAPFDRVAVLRALPSGAMAVAGGAWLAVFVVVLAGADLRAGALAWVAVAGACACLGGLVAGSGGSVVPAGLLLVAAVAAAVLAAGTARADRAPLLRAADLAPRLGTGGVPGGGRAGEPRAETVGVPRATSPSDATSRATTGAAPTSSRARGRA
jgi:hypothetical protein